MSDPTEIIPGVRPGYLTGDVPPIGGEIRARIEDFLVDEEPLYQPSGEGEHIYLFVEKRGRSTHQAVDALARHFGVERRAVEADVVGRRGRHELLEHLQQSAVLRAALEVFERAKVPGYVEHLPFVWHEAPEDTKWHPAEPSPIIAMMKKARAK